MAESFGTDPALYDRVRPQYPAGLIDAVVAAAPGRDLLDVGCGTGITSRQFQAAGCRGLGLDVDERMAAHARSTGVEVEVSPFEVWDPAGRTFDALTAGMTWHWIEPEAGARKSAEVLRPGGRFAIFWYVLQPPPELAEAFAAVYREVLPDSPLNPQAAVAPGSAYARFMDRTADCLLATGAFEDVERPTFPWTRHYTRDKWLDQIRTAGTAQHLASTGKLDAILAGVGGAIDATGGEFTIDSEVVALTAGRR